MYKYIAFNLYRRNEHGAFQTAAQDERKEVYLASDVEALIAEMAGDKIRIAALIEGLKRFGIHTIECEALAAGSDEKNCDCGLNRLMESGR